jgi:hypothetical protein
LAKSLSMRGKTLFLRDRAKMPKIPPHTFDHLRGAWEKLAGVAVVLCARRHHRADGQELTANSFFSVFKEQPLCQECSTERISA